MNETAGPDRSDASQPIATQTEANVTEESGAALLGAVDIVQAFTALRHELKLQVRAGRDLQEATVSGFERVEQAVLGLSRSLASPAVSSEGDASARRMAESITEIEEALQRAVVAMQQAGAVERAPLAPPVIAVLQRRYAAWPKWKRWLSGSWLQETCDEIEQTLRSVDRQEHWLSATEGTELLLARVHRLMAQCELQRVDVAGLPFDSESMNAIELVQTAQCPSGHVAEQLRPAYLWRQAVLKTAEVRVQR